MQRFHSELADLTTTYTQFIQSQGRNHVFKVGVQFLGLGYCTEQNTESIPSVVYCSLLRNGNHTLHQKSWGGPSKFWGSGLPPQWLRPCSVLLTAIGRWTIISVCIVLHIIDNNVHNKTNIDRVKILRPTRHRTCHFGDVLPSQSLGIVLKKLNLTQQKHIYTNKLQHKIIQKAKSNTDKL